MKISKIEHLGIAVQNIAEVLPYYTDVLGLEFYKEEVVEDQKVKTAFLKVGEVKIELLEPTCPESTIQKFLDNGGRGIHHIAFKVEEVVEFTTLHLRLRMVLAKHWHFAMRKAYVQLTRLPVEVLMV